MLHARLACERFCDDYPPVLVRGTVPSLPKRFRIILITNKSMAASLGPKGPLIPPDRQNCLSNLAPVFADLPDGVGEDVYGIVAPGRLSVGLGVVFLPVGLDELPVRSFIPGTESTNPTRPSAASPARSRNAFTAMAGG